MKTMDQWYYMRPGFTTFRFEPETHRQYLFGERDRAQRDFLLEELEGAAFSGDGYKAAIYGDFGRGKTHQSQNLVYEINRRDLPVVPVYVKCTAYTSKEPFSSLFKELVLRHQTTEVNRVATEYAKMVADGSAKPIQDVIQLEDVALVFRKGLTAGEPDVVRSSMRWLGGEHKIQMGLISNSLQPHLADSREFGAVMRGLVHMFSTVDKKIPLYLVDEAERFENVTNVDTYANWLASMRELTEIVRVGFVFFIGAKTRNNLPVLFVQDEVVRRIGSSNYVEFTNPSRDQLEEFMFELLDTMILKGEVPGPHRHCVVPEALTVDVPKDLMDLVKHDPDRLKKYPFEPDAFDAFVEQVTVGDLASKPSEVLQRLQKAAQKAMRAHKRLIDIGMVEAIAAEGWQ